MGGLGERERNRRRTNNRSAGVKGPGQGRGMEGGGGGERVVECTHQMGKGELLAQTQEVCRIAESTFLRSNLLLPLKHRPQAFRRRSSS